MNPRFRITLNERRQGRRVTVDDVPRFQVAERRVGVVFCGSEEECRQYVGAKIGGFTYKNGRLVETIIPLLRHEETPQQRLHRQIAQYGGKQ